MTSSATKRVYEISIALPRGYGKEHAPYPVLYAVDADEMFGTIVETAREFANSVPDVVIVGIGYPDAAPGSGDAWRNLDLTPTSDPVWMEQHAKMKMARGRGNGKPEPTGGAPEFLAFLRNELVPAIERDYNVSHDDRAFLGHSFGALFGVYALLNNNGLFRRFVIASPSLWWDHRSIFRLEESFAASGKPLPVKAFFAVGALEDQRDGPNGPYAAVSSLRDFVARLEKRHYKGFDLQAHYFDNETHGSVIPVAIRWGLDFVYSKPAP